MYALDLHRKARAHIGRAIPQGLVLSAAVVPKRNRMGLPAETAVPFIAADVAVEKLQHRLALTARQLVDVAGEVAIDKEAAAPDLGVAHDHRVRGLGRAQPKHPGAVVGGGEPDRKAFILSDSAS